MIRKNKLETILFITLDIVVILLSYVITLVLIKLIDGNALLRKTMVIMPLIIIPKIIINYYLNVYKTMRKSFNLNNAVTITSIVLSTNLVLSILFYLAKLNYFHISAFFIITSLEILGLIMYRSILRIGIDLFGVKSTYNSKKTIIIGAGQAGDMALREILNNKSLKNEVVGFLDDDINKVGKTISNVLVMGKINELENIIKKHNIEEVILAIKNYPKEKTNELIKIINKYNEVKLSQVNLISELNKESNLKIIDVKVEDLLKREEIKLDDKGIKDLFKDEIVLITGGGGSIGSELSRQIFNLKPKEVIIFDIYENNAYEIQMELERLKYKDKTIKTKVTTLIGSVYNFERFEKVFKNYKPTLVFHAAAYKHVPLMENSPEEAIRTNVIGTYNTAKLASKYNVKKMVLVSSDKAVRPTNIMGATKRYAEMIIGYFNTLGKTKYSSVRFGNVLGSNGSVIPLFKQQIKDGGPLTVTHKEITRYFMTIPEAVGLILQSALYAKGGEIFVLDMGSPVKIYELAENMIMLSGLKPHVDIKIDIVGLRPGEKLYEELLVDSNSNNIMKTDHSRIFVEKEENGDFSRIDIDYVFENIEKYDNNHLKKMIKHVVNSYNIDNKK